MLSATQSRFAKLVLTSTFSFALSACSTSVTIIPVDENGVPVADAEVRVDGILRGTGATHVRVGGDYAKQIAINSGPLHFSALLAVDDESESTIRIALPLDRAAADTISSTESKIRANEFVTLGIANGYEQSSEWWRILIDGVSGAQYQPVLIDERSGYLATEWREKRYTVTGHQQPTIIRRRIIGNIVSQQPLRYRLKLQVERKDLDHPDFSAWNRVYREDSELIADIATRAQASGGFASGTASAAPVYPARSMQPVLRPVSVTPSENIGDGRGYLRGNVSSFAGPVY